MRPLFSAIPLPPFNRVNTLPAIVAPVQFNRFTGVVDTHRQAVPLLYADPVKLKSIKEAKIVAFEKVIDEKIAVAKAKLAAKNTIAQRREQKMVQKVKSEVP